MSPAQPGAQHELAIALLVVAYRSSADLAALVASLRPEVVRCRLTVSVVDNSCDETEFAAVCSAVRPAEQTAHVVLTQAASNDGFAAGTRLAWAALGERQAEIDVVVLCNPDVEFVSGSLAGAARTALADDVLVGVPTVTNGGIESGLARLHPFTGKTRAAPHASRGFVYPAGHLLALRAGLFVELGGIDPVFFLYGEELDLVLRLRELRGDARVVSGPGLTVRHAGGGSTGPSTSPLVQFHASRSRVVLYRRHRSLRRYLIPMVAARCARAALLTLGGKRAAGRAVAVGLRAGISANAIGEPAARRAAAWYRS